MEKSSGYLNITNKEAWGLLYAVSARWTTAAKSGFNGFYKANKPFIWSVCCLFCEVTGLGKLLPFF